VYQKYFKRVIDIICAGSALIVFSWLYAIVAILVRIKLGSPVLFKQERPGKDEKLFTLYKFRTMTDERDNEGNLVPDEVRLTPFGKWLRSNSLDEITEAFNILKGDMSVVGPRPLLIEYLPLYSEEQKKRHSVLPGLTGLAQIEGRNELRWEDKFTQDVEYSKHIRFSTDLRIVIKTILKAFVQKDGICQKGQATMEAFKGNGLEDTIK
jgi:lipopolysaccharide/colanic/teichoic acid biosynthesis glycosyltransferase